MKATKHGNTWYADDAEYTVVDDQTVQRGDGSYAVLDHGMDADTIAEALCNGDRDDSDFDWSE